MNAQLLRVEFGESDKVTVARSLYNKYGAMLLGYILEIVKSQPIAEQYLVEVFNEILTEADQFSDKGLSTFNQLQTIARKKLSSFLDTVKSCDNSHWENGILIGKNKYIAQMTAEQRLVFCGMHYHGKTASALAAELNKPEDTIKKLLKESFTIIRRGNGN